MSDLPSAGPYAFTLNDVNRSDVATSQPVLEAGARPHGAAEPRRVSTSNWNLNEQTAFEHGESEPARRGADPGRRGAERREPVRRQPEPVLGEADELVHRADRVQQQSEVSSRETLRLAQGGELGPRPDRLLRVVVQPLSVDAPAAPGILRARSRSRALQPYAPTANIDKAYALAAGHLKDGRITVYFRSSGSLNQAQAENVRRALLSIGFDYANITMKGFPGGEIYDAMGRAGSDFDLAVSLGWCNVQGSPFLPFGGVPPFFPDLPQYRGKIAAALRLEGNARAAALGKLDLDIMRNVAPVAVTNIYNNRYFFSNRVDPRSLEYHRVYQDWSIPALALK